MIHVFAVTSQLINCNNNIDILATERYPRYPIKAASTFLGNMIRYRLHACVSGPLILLVIPDTISFHMSSHIILCILAIYGPYLPLSSPTILEIRTSSTLIHE